MTVTQTKMGMRNVTEKGICDLCNIDPVQFDQEMLRKCVNGTEKFNSLQQYPNPR